MLIVLAASLVADAAWMYLLVGHGMFWRTDQRLPAEPVPAAWPDVVAVVPARDEAGILPQTLPTLLNQEYQGQLTVLLVDDESSDGTADVAAALGAAHPGRLRVIAGEPAPLAGRARSGRWPRACGPPARPSSSCSPTLTSCMRRER